MAVTPQFIASTFEPTKCTTESTDRTGAGSYHDCFVAGSGGALFKGLAIQAGTSFGPNRINIFYDDASVITMIGSIIVRQNIVPTPNVEGWSIVWRPRGGDMVMESGDTIQMAMEIDQGATLHVTPLGGNW